MAHVPESRTGATPYERVMGHAPHVLAPWTQLEEAFFQRSVLPRDLLEQVRRTLALGHGCEYCQAKGGPPDAQHDVLRTSMAVVFPSFLLLATRILARGRLKCCAGTSRIRSL